MKIQYFAIFIYIYWNNTDEIKYNISEQAITASLKMLE